VSKDQTNVPETQTSEFVTINAVHSFEEKGDTIRGMVLAYYKNADYKPENGSIPGQFLIATDEGFMRINQTHQLSILQTLPTGTEVEIEYKGEIKTARNFKVKTFDVRILRTNFQDLMNSIRNKMVQMLPVYIEGGIDTVQQIGAASEDEPDKDPFADEQP